MTTEKSKLPTVHIPTLIEMAQQEALSKTESVTEAAKLLGVARSTLYRRVKDAT
jgi:transcriptional regulator of acetoin/glycerol metabolism